MFTTIHDYLYQYPDVGLDLLTPAGMVQIMPKEGHDLLSPAARYRKLPVIGTNNKVIVSDLLHQRICKIIRYPQDPWRVFIVTDLPAVTASGIPSSFYEQTSFL